MLCIEHMSSVFSRMRPVLGKETIVSNAKHENREAPKRLTADELQLELEKVRHSTPGNHPGNDSGKRKHGRAELGRYCLPAGPLCGSIAKIWICGIILM